MKNPSLRAGHAGLAMVVLSFAVTSCGDDAAPTGPTTGNVEVSAVTTGSDIDPDGYTVSIDPGTGRAIAANGTVTFSGLSVGSHAVELSGVAANCTVAGDNPRSVSVTAGGTASTTFNVTCAALTGDLEVTTSTTGSDLDPDGYSVSVDGGTAQSIGVNATLAITGLAEGDHELQLAGVAANCTVGGDNPRTVAVTAGGTAETQFDVVCSTQVGTLDVTVSTSGNGQPAGYSFTVDGGTAQAIGVNATVSLTGVAAGNHSVLLTDIPTSCSVSGFNPVNVSVPADGTGTATFTVVCAQGSLDVTTSTWGLGLDADGYQVVVDGDTTAAGVNTTINIPNLDVGDHTVELTGLAANCTVQNGDNPRTESVADGVATPTTFDVFCFQPLSGQIAFDTDRGGNSEVYVMSASGSSQTNLTRNGAYDGHPAVSPTGNAIVFETDRGGSVALWKMDAAGFAKLTSAQAQERHPSYAADLSGIAFQRKTSSTNWQIWTVNINGSSSQQVSSSLGNNTQPAYSPDGDWILFRSDRDGNGEIYVVNVANPGVEFRLTNDPADEGKPAWDWDGSRIIFVSDQDGDFEIYAAVFDPVTPSIGPVEQLTDNAADDLMPDMRPDGSSIAFVRTGDIWKMDPDGLNPVQLTNAAGNDAEPSWSP